MAIHSSSLAWTIPWTEEPDGLQSMGSQRVGHDVATQQQQQSSAHLLWSDTPPLYKWTAEPHRANWLKVTAGDGGETFRPRLVILLALGLSQVLTHTPWSLEGWALCDASPGTSESLVVCISCSFWWSCLALFLPLWTDSCRGRGVHSDPPQASAPGVPTPHGSAWPTGSRKASGVFPQQ